MFRDFEIASIGLFLDANDLVSFLQTSNALKDQIPRLVEFPLPIRFCGCREPSPCGCPEFTLRKAQARGWTHFPSWKILLTGNLPTKRSPGVREVVVFGLDCENFDVKQFAQLFPNLEKFQAYEQTDRDGELSVLDLTPLSKLKELHIDSGSRDGPFDLARPIVVPISLRRLAGLFQLHDPRTVTKHLESNQNADDFATEDLFSMGLSWDKLTSLKTVDPGSSCRFPTLRHLDLEFCSAGAALPSCPVLEHLELRTDTSLESLLAASFQDGKSPRVKKLTLHFYDPTVKVCEGSLPTLETLELLTPPGRRLDSVDLWWLTAERFPLLSRLKCEYLRPTNCRSLPSLRHLDLDFWSQSNVGAEVDPCLLQDGLETLSILSSPMPDEVWTRVLDRLANLRMLQVDSLEAERQFDGLRAGRKCNIVVSPFRFLSDSSA